MNTNKSRLFEGKRIGIGGGDGGGDSAFNGQRPMTRNTPGILGVNPDAATVIEMLEKVFYPLVAPICHLSVNNPTREVGEGADYILTYEVIKQTGNITGIIVDGQVITPTGGNQTGTIAGTLPDVTGYYQKSMSVTDGNLTGTASVIINYLARVFWGTTAKNGISNPILDIDILGLSGSALSANKDKSLANFGGGATRLIFAFPSILGKPTFTVNGLENTAFTKVRAASNFVNIQGATLTMDVWVSDNIYNSPLASIIIS